MIRTNKEYAKRVKERLMEKDPELYSELSELKIRGILNFFTKNIAITVYKHRHASVTNFFNIYPNANQLFEYRMTLILKKSYGYLSNYFKILKEEERMKTQRYHDRNQAMFDKLG